VGGEPLAGRLGGGWVESFKEISVHRLPV
jgi:hypothetical protein